MLILFITLIVLAIVFVAIYFQSRNTIYLACAVIVAILLLVAAITQGGIPALVAQWGVSWR